MSIVYAGLALCEICVLFASAIGVLVFAARWVARWIVGDLSVEISEIKQKRTPLRALSGLETAMQTARARRSG